MVSRSSEERGVIIAAGQGLGSTRAVLAKLSFLTPPHRRAERIKHGANRRHAGKKFKKEIKMEHKGMEDNVAHARPKVAPSERI